MRLKKWIGGFICLFMFLTSNILAAPQLSNNAQVSVLTQEKGSEIYALWGHTAIRIKDDSLGIDHIFNYGIFDFSSPNFAWRFVNGETDYILGINNLNDVWMEGVIRNLDLTEQTLNLTAGEKQRLWDSLMENARPENRTYRYSFAFDNCATRPLSMIEKSLDYPLVFSDTTATGGTLRSIVHETTDDYPWLKLGINTVFGSRFDQPVTFREQFFHPSYLKKALNEAYVTDSLTGQKRMLVSKSVLLLQHDDTVENDEASYPAPGWFFYPIGALILLLTLFRGLRKGKLCVGVDVVLYLLFGIAGCILYFLAFVSTHPGMYPNGLLLVFEPLQLIYALALLVRPWRKKVLLFNWVNAIMTFAFILSAPFVTQIYPIEILFLGMVSLIRSIMWIKIRRFCCEK